MLKISVCLIIAFLFKAAALVNEGDIWQLNNNLMALKMNNSQNN